MALGLRKKEQLEEAQELTRALKRKISPLDITTQFQSRTIDSDFEEIGAAYIGRKRAERVKAHLLCWIGWEFCTGSARLDS